MKQLFLFISMLSCGYTYSQCYIQYGYDASGNRTSRTYIGGCGKPAPSVNGGQAQLTTQSDGTVIDEQGVSQEGGVIAYHLYPNPSYGLINLDVPTSALKGIKYVIFDPTGAEVKSAAILSNRNIVDISDILTGSFIISVIDGTGRRLYTSQIIKM